MSRWMIYGAYGYTGRLIVEEAVKRGHRPVLAGRSPAKLAPLAERYGLEYLVLSLDNEASLNRAVADFDLVYHVAGPYLRIAAPMVRACLAGRAHYLDLTGELPVIEMIFAHDDRAKEQGVALIPGAGFDVIPTDCLAVYVASQLPGALSLDLAIASSSAKSAGTIKTTLEVLPGGGTVRRDGRYVSWALGQDVRRLRFSDGRERVVMASPLGDLATAYRSTGIPNITVYLAFPAKQADLIGRIAPLSQKLMSLKVLRRLAQEMVAVTVKGPDEKTRQTARSYLYVRATGAAGGTAEAWLETMEAYRFTAVAGVRGVERVLAGNLSGALTPAQAFGVDFVLAIDDTRRYDTLTG